MIDYKSKKYNGGLAKTIQLYLANHDEFSQNSLTADDLSAAREVINDYFAVDIYLISPNVSYQSYVNTRYSDINKVLQEIIMKYFPGGQLNKKSLTYVHNGEEDPRNAYFKELCKLMDPQKLLVKNIYVILNHTPSNYRTNTYSLVLPETEMTYNIVVQYTNNSCVSLAYQKFVMEELHPIAE